MSIRIHQPIIPIKWQLLNQGISGSLHRNGAVDHWQAFATPTRRPSARGRNNVGLGRPEVNQENNGRMADQERGARRVRRATSWDLSSGEID